MDKEKLSFPVQETGGEPWAADKETQTDDDDNIVEVNVRVWQNNVEEKTSDPPIDDWEDLQRSVRLDYSNGRENATPSTMETPNSPSITNMTPQNLEVQATGHSSNPCHGATDNVNVSRVMEYRGDPFWLLVQDRMNRLPQERRTACEKEILDVVFKHAADEVPTPPRNNP
ncbi:uncharacterized protein RB166_012223 [Leptodactylus fuscus]